MSNQTLLASMEAAGMVNLKRKAFGGVPLKNEFCLSHKANLCRLWLKHEGKFDSQAALMRFVSKHTGRAIEQIRAVLNEGDSWEKALKAQGQKDSNCRNT